MIDAVRSVAVLGSSGTVGNLVGGLFAQQGIKVYFLSRTLDGAKSGLKKAMDQARSEVISHYIECGDYDQMLENALEEADLIIESVSENLEIKRKIYQKVEVLGAEQPIFAEGDKGDGAYFILEGRVKVVALSPGFNEILLGELGEGEIFGEMALIDEKPRSASLVTLTPCKVGFISKTAFNEFIGSRTELAFRLMGFICLSLFRRILRLDKLYSDIKKGIKDS